ncbi:MAG: SDR family oxidoreductase [Rubellimicrobium sp.]|nr:SDR family oxidoreductase [Rubellimicrobium sp.]
MQDKRIVITGAGGGLGQALVARFAAAGAHVIACDRPGADLSALPVVETHLFDIADRTATLAAARAITANGPPDAVISNAGLTRAETLATTGPDEIEAELALNYTGAAHLTRALLPAMGAGSAFVFIASVNALAHFGNPAYSAAKAALIAWSRAIATEAGARGIRSNVVAPGSIRTPAWDHRIEKDPTLPDRLRGLYPAGRLVTPDEVAQAVFFLASPAASGITGVTLPVDNGLTAGNLPFLSLIGGDA